MISTAYFIKKLFGWNHIKFPFKRWSLIIFSMFTIIICDSAIYPSFDWNVHCFSCFSCFQMKSLFSRYPFPNGLLIVCQPVRFARMKPWSPKFRLLRQMQPWDGPPDLHEDGLYNSPINVSDTASDLRQRYRRMGILPPLLFQDRPINVGHSGNGWCWQEPMVFSLSHFGSDFSNRWSLHDKDLFDW